MNPKETEIIEATKEFARINGIHFDELTANMILNAMREYLKQSVGRRQDLPKCTRVEVIDDTGRTFGRHDYFGVQTRIQDGGKTLKIFASG